MSPTQRVFGAVAVKSLVRLVDDPDRSLTELPVVLVALLWHRYSLSLMPPRAWGNLRCAKLAAKVVGIVMGRDVTLVILPSLKVNRSKPASFAELAE